MSTSRKSTVTVHVGSTAQTTVDVDVAVPSEQSVPCLQPGVYRFQNAVPVAVHSDGISRITVDLRGYRYEATVHNRHHYELLSVLQASPAMKSRTTKVSSPMPGLIKSVYVQDGTVVTKGTTLCTLEAMKMENAIVAPIDGVVRALSATESTAVEKGTLLCILEPTSSVDV